MTQFTFEQLSEAILESPDSNATITIVGKSGQVYQTTYHSWKEFQNEKDADLICMLKEKKGQLHIDVEDIEAVII